MPPLTSTEKFVFLHSDHGKHKGQQWQGNQRQRGEMRTRQGGGKRWQDSSSQQEMFITKE